MKSPTIRELNDFFDKELYSNVKDKVKLCKFISSKMENLVMVKAFIDNPEYKISKYNIFLVYEPKLRVIMSLNIADKLVNHYFTMNVLEPITEPLLDPRNIATRKGMGTDYGIKLIRKYLTYYKNRYHNNFYYLKIDIRKFFFSIDHEVLKSLLMDRLDADDYQRLCNLVDSTDDEYINHEIIRLCGEDATDLYTKGKGLGIGNLSSQCLSVFYLYKLDHFIVHDLHLKHYIRYMDDFIIFSNNKEKLLNAKKIIVDKLFNEYKLEVSKKKTYIKSIKQGAEFLGYRFTINKNNKIIMLVRKESYKRIKKNIKRVYYDYNRGYISFDRFFASITNYRYSYYGSVMKIRRYIDRINFEYLIKKEKR